VKYLLAVMHPRRLPYFLESIRRIDYVDIALAKNYDATEALNILRSYALKNDYDYMILTSDDVIIPYNAPLKIMLDCELYNPPAITGYSRINPYTQYVNLTLKPIPNIERRVNTTIWMHEYGFISIYDVLSNLYNGNEILKVWFVGFSLTAIRNDILEKWIPKPFNQNGCHDLQFTYETWKMNIDRYADLTVYIPHIPTGKSGLLVGVEPPELEVKRKTKNISLNIQ